MRKRFSSRRRERLRPLPENFSEFLKPPLVEYSSRGSRENRVKVEFTISAPCIQETSTEFVKKQEFEATRAVSVKSTLN